MLASGPVQALVAGPRLAVALVLLTGVAAAVTVAAGLGSGRRTAFAAARASLQLAAVSALIAAIVRQRTLASGFVAVMATVASVTSARRVTGRWWPGWTALPVVGASLPVVLALLAGGVLPPAGVAVIPVAGILIGGAMTATTLAGRRALDELTTRRGEFEAGLALGLPERAAALLVVRPSAGQALLPGLDQTRTVGLVTLPGAFVGVLLGGGSPLAAGAVQLLVLVALLAVQAVAVALTVELVARGRLRPRRP